MTAQGCRCHVDPSPGTIHDKLAIALDDQAKRWGVSPDDILSVSRRALVVRARKAVYVQMREHGFSYPEIGDVMGFDHTSVMHGVKSSAPRKRVAG